MYGTIVIYLETALQTMYETISKSVSRSNSLHQPARMMQDGTAAMIVLPDVYRNFYESRHPHGMPDDLNVSRLYVFIQCGNALICVSRDP
jgi:hypothetical protein